MKHSSKKPLLIQAVVIILFLCNMLYEEAYAEIQDSPVAVRIQADEIKEGDNVIIVCNYRKDGNYKALSLNTNGNYIYPSDIPEVIDENTSYGKLPDTLSEISGNIAIFKVSFADGSGGMYLSCSQGYISVVTNSGRTGIGYVPAKESSSIWTIEDGQYMKSSGYYAEYYSTYSDFTVYQKKYDSYNYQFQFYRVNSGQEEETEAYRLPVFETSDVHGCLAYTTDTPYQYRMAYIADKVNDIRNNDPSRAVLLDGGDIFQGEMISNREGGRSMSAAYDLMRYDAVTIGNHEFDWGIDTVFDDTDNTMLDYIIDGQEKPNTVPVIAANILKNGQQISLAYPYLILNKAAFSTSGETVPVRIAVIGFAEDYTQSIMTDKFTALGYSILDMTESYKLVNGIAAELEGKGECDATILLAHGEADDIAEALGKDTAIDLVLGGHTHTNILGRTTWGLPYMEPRNAAQSYCYTNLIFKIDDEGKVVFYGTDALQAVSTTERASKEQNEASGQTELDPAVANATDYYLERVLQYLNRIIGYIDTPVERYVYLPNSGERATTAGNWSTSIMKRSVEADVAMVNAHGLRTDFLPSDNGRKYISVADVFRMYPFDNTIYLYELTYDEFITVLSYAMTEEGSGLLTNMTGIDCYYMDGAVKALVREDDEVIYLNGEWTPGWKDKKLRLAVNSYSATSDRPANGVSNPLVAWNNSSRLISSNQDQFENAVRVLLSEAATGDGRLDIDTSPHLINLNLDYMVSPTAKTGLIYNGTPQELVTAGKSTRGAMQYVLGADATTAPTDGYTTSVPTATNAGTYYVWYRVVGDENYDDTVPVCVTVTIISADSVVYSDDVTITADDLAGMPDEKKQAIKTLTLIDLEDLMKISYDKLPSLTTMKISEATNIEAVDLSKLPVSLDTFSFSGNNNIKTLKLGDNKVKNIGAAGCKNLESVDLGGNDFIVSLNVSNSPKLAALNASNCSNLQYIDCSSCWISSLDIEACANLISIDCSHNNLLKLDIDKTEMRLAALNVLICAGQSLGNWEAVLNLDFNAFMESPNLAANPDKISASLSSVRVADFSKVKNLKAYVKDVEIAITSDDSGKVIFVSLPDKFTYEYETGFNKTLMDVQVSAASTDGEISGAGVGCNATSGMEIDVRNILFVIVLELVFMLRKLHRH